jgi:hypothetical protein
MKSSAFYAVIGLGVLAIIGVIWFGYYHEHTQKLAAATAVGRAATTTPLTGLSIYTNGTYGFSIFYPSQDPVETTFDEQYHLPGTWRVNALQDATGTPVIAIVGYQTKSSSSYPRYFESEVRIGVSSDPKEVAACETTGNGETALPSVSINGVSWKAFTLQDDGMMQYLSGMSYRTVHDGSCYALEQIETGSSYQDDPPSSADISEATLTQHYKDLTSIVQSFSFARS